MLHVGDEGTGARIATYRKLRGLTQRGLALKANVAYGTLTKIESGHSMAQPAVIAAVARALSVNVTHLTGQPYLDELRRDNLEQYIQGLRIALDSYDLGPSEDVTPRPVGEIRAEMVARCRDMRAGRLDVVAGAMPGLLDELSARVAGDGHDHAAWEVMAQGYHCVFDVAATWGFPDLAMVALNRMGWAGGFGDDPLLEPVCRYLRTIEHLRNGEYRHVSRLLESALRLTDDAPGSRERFAVIGQLHLLWSINAARAGDGDESEAHLADAEHCADQVGEVHDIYWFGFGPTNVAVHRVAALIERSLYDKAVAAAADLEIPDDWHATRISHHFMDLGRAYAWLGRDDAALAALGRSRAAAPQRTRYHPTTRDTIEHLLDRKRRVPERLASYARWLGL
jgi:transcriptional regulator with XRE-family HTH domain